MPVLGALQPIINAALDAVIVIDVAGSVRAWNRGAEQTFGWSGLEAIGVPMADLVVPDHLRDAHNQGMARFLKTGDPHVIGRRIEIDGRHRDGRVFPVELTITDADLDGERLFVGYLRDISERRRSEADLRKSAALLAESKSRFEAAVRAVQGVLWTNDAEGRMTGEQPGWSALTGQTQGEYENFGWAGAVHPEDVEATLQAWNEAVAERKPFIFEHRLQRHDGTWGTFSIRAIPTFDAKGSIAEWVGVHTDVTLQRSNEDALHAFNTHLEHRVSEALAERRLLAEVVEGTDAFVQVLDKDFRWLAINRAAASEFQRMFGVTPRTGQSMLEVLADQPELQDTAQAFWARALRGEEFTETAEFNDPDGTRRFYEMKYNVLCDADGRQVGAYQFVHDVTARIQEQERLARAEEQLRHVQKMEAMGQLTGGVAHDFNNLLTPILGALDMLERKGVGGDREQRLIAGALQSAERAKTLVQRLLAFARRQPLQAKAVNVGELISGMADLVSSTIGPQIKVLVEIEPGLPPAKADPNQLEMALLNLAVNARDAMAEVGVLRLTAERAEVPRNGVGGLRPGDYIRVSVADTGTGMDEATMARATEPFFSTKGVGQGTGLGLSMVHGLVQQLGGELQIRSKPGLGTNVELWLPRSEEDPVTPELLPTALGPAKLRGSVLLVDDEDLVRASTAEMLVDMGYEVQEARSAEDALSMVNGGLRPSMVITDHLMPGMTGVDLAAAMRAKLPGLPVLLVSGFAEHSGIDVRLPLLSKPFRNSDLAQSIAALL